MIPYIAVLVLIIVAILYQVYKDIESFTSASTMKVVVRDASGNQLMTKDASGSEIKLSLSDLYALLGPFKMDASGNTIKAPAPAQTKPTTASTKELEKRISKSVEKKIKDDLVSQRSVDEVYDKYAPCDLTDAEAQGQEYGKQNPRPSAIPDMSEYIRKDSIPCWNCSVP